MWKICNNCGVLHRHSAKEVWSPMASTPIPWTPPFHGFHVRERNEFVARVVYTCRDWLYFFGGSAMVETFAVQIYIIRLCSYRFISQIFRSFGHKVVLLFQMWLESSITWFHLYNVYPKENKTHWYNLRLFFPCNTFTHDTFKDQSTIFVFV